MTTGGATSVLMLRNTLNVRTMMPSRFSRLASVIFTAFADFTRKITDILRERASQIFHCASVFYSRILSTKFYFHCQIDKRSRNPAIWRNLWIQCFKVKEWFGKTDILFFYLTRVHTLAHSNARVRTQAHVACRSKSNNTLMIKYSFAERIQYRFTNFESIRLYLQCACVCVSSKYIYVYIFLINLITCKLKDL